MKTCTNCNTQNEDNSLFCESCGGKLTNPDFQTSESNNLNYANVNFSTPLSSSSNKKIILIVAVLAIIGIVTASIMVFINFKSLPNNNIITSPEDSNLQRTREERNENNDFQERTETLEFEYRFNEELGDIEITRYNREVTEDYTTIDIPETIDGKPVVSIGSGAFKDVGYSVEYNDRDGFHSVHKILTVNLPDSIINIEADSFTGASINTSIIYQGVSYNLEIGSVSKVFDDDNYLANQAGFNNLVSISYVLPQSLFDAVMGLTNSETDNNLYEFDDGTTKVPDLVNLNLTQARINAEEYRIILVITEEESSEDDKGKVIRQSIDPMTEVENWTMVEVLVGTGEPEEKTSDISFSINNKYSGDYVFTYYIDGEFFDTKTIDVGIKKDIKWEFTNTGVHLYTIKIKCVAMGKEGIFCTYEIDFDKDPPQKSEVYFNRNILSEISESAPAETTAPSWQTDPSSQTEPPPEWWEEE